MSSVAGKESYAKGSVYCASKFAVEAISDALRKELIGMFFDWIFLQFLIPRYSYSSEQNMSWIGFRDRILV
jgi:hypothetical protein